MNDHENIGAGELDAVGGAGSDGINQKVLPTGATGFIGGRLLLKLDEQGYRVRCLGWIPYFPGRMGGPVRVRANLYGTTSPRPVIASQRVIWNGYCRQLQNVLNVGKTNNMQNLANFAVRLGGAKCF